MYQRSISNIDKDILRIGVQQDNAATFFLINASEWADEFPDAFLTAAYKTPSGKLQLTNAAFTSDNNILWVITKNETYEPGIGYVEFRLSTDSGTVLRSKTAKCLVYPSLTSEDDDPQPGPYPGEPVDIAETAYRLYTPREIALTGNVFGSSMFDGSEDIQISTVVSTITNTELKEMLK